MFDYFLYSRTARMTRLQNQRLSLAWRNKNPTLDETQYIVKQFKRQETGNIFLHSDNDFIYVGESGMRVGVKVLVLSVLDLRPVHQLEVKSPAEDLLTYHVGQIKISSDDHFVAIYASHRLPRWQEVSRYETSSLNQKFYFFFIFSCAAGVYHNQSPYCWITAHLLRFSWSNLQNIFKLKMFIIYTF